MCNQLDGIFLGVDVHVTVDVLNHLSQLAGQRHPCALTTLLAPDTNSASYCQGDCPL
jgi:hypothetical protein